MSRDLHDVSRLERDVNRDVTRGSDVTGTSSTTGANVGTGSTNYSRDRDLHEAQQHVGTAGQRIREAGEHALQAGRQVTKKAYHEVCDACHNWRHIPKFQSGLALFGVLTLGLLLGSVLLPAGLGLFRRVSPYSVYKDRDIRDAHEALDVLLDHMKAARYHGLEPSIWSRSKARLDRIIDTIAHPWGSSSSDTSGSNLFGGFGLNSPSGSGFNPNMGDRLADLGQRAKETIYSTTQGMMPSSSSGKGYGAPSSYSPGVMERVKQWIPGVTSGSSSGYRDHPTSEYGRGFTDDWKERMMSGGKLRSEDEVDRAASTLRHVTSEAEAYPRK